MLDYKAVGLRLADLRRKHGLKPGEAAARAGVTAKSWRKWESAETHFNTGSFLKICRAFDCSCDWLACGDEGAVMRRKFDHDLDPIDRLNELADIAAAISVGLISFRELNWAPARHGFIKIANDLYEGIKEVSDQLYSEAKKEHLRVVPKS